VFCHFTNSIKSSDPLWSKGKKLIVIKGAVLFYFLNMQKDLPLRILGAEDLTNAE
jgi:hypothetical protein